MPAPSRGIIKCHLVGLDQFFIGSILSSDNDKVKDLYKIPDITEYDIQILEIEIDKMTEELPELTNH